MQAFEQGRGGFIGQIGEFRFIGERGDFIGNGGQFFQRPHRLVPRMLGGKLAQGFFRQVVGFVYTVKAIFGCRQNHASTHTDIDHQQIVVGHHHIHRFQGVARQIKRAFGAVRAGGFQTAVVIVIHLHPQRVVDALRPGVAVAVEAAGGKFVSQLTQ